jgi:acyl-CoA synthetase (AMP-forming)/AMP-acid ligase II
MHPRETAARIPGKPAIIGHPSGVCVTYGELVDRSNRAAQLFRSLGLRPGDGVAICMENHPRYLELCWGAHNAGLYYTPISSRLRPSETAYIVRDSGARVLITSAALAETVADLPGELLAELRCYMMDSTIEHFASYEAAIATMPGAPLSDEIQGAAMVYSSGTTGAPKGVKPALPGLRPDEPAALVKKLIELYGFASDTVYLSTAPLYHTAPLKFSLTVLAAGGTVVGMERFDAEEGLRCIQDYGVTHSQWVPTMFIRLLRLPELTRTRYDLGTHRVAIHAAAPCPVDVKEQMLAWWGPIVHEYYGGSESIGMCAITPHEWLKHKGSVGKAARGEVHVLNEQGIELAPNETGTVYFANGAQFEYHNDPEKTARAYNERGWATFGDIGHVDDEGYLYLTDRRDYVINSGGVNIYPQEAENLLCLHPKVADVAVFGVPNEEFGEEVKAVVVPRSKEDAGPRLAQELIDHCRLYLSSIKCPRSIDFASDLPREPTGKVIKRHIRARYWTGRGSH